MEKEYVEKSEMLAMINYSNIEISKTMDNMNYCNPETYHWIDQFYKQLKNNAKKLKIIKLEP